MGITPGITPSSLTPAQARTSGFDDVPSLIGALLRGARGRGAPLPADEPLFLVTFHRVADDAPGPPALDDDLSAEDVERLTRKLDQMDRRSSAGAWTRPTLALIAERPSTRAADLAEALGRDRTRLKADIRKLKGLGLTLSLETGYTVSPRGAAWLAAAQRSENSRHG